MSAPSESAPSALPTAQFVGVSEDAAHRPGTSTNDHATQALTNRRAPDMPADSARTDLTVPSAERARSTRGLLTLRGLRGAVWPWEHAVFGYVAYLAARPRALVRADRYAILAALAGSQFPDLIDKPLAWVFGVLPSGRSLAHSLFALAVVCTAVYAFFHVRRREVGLGFAVGYLTHLVGDAIGPALEGSYGELGFLLWPLTPAPAYDEPLGLHAVLSALANATLGARFLLGVAVAAAVGTLLLVHFVRFASWRAR